MRRNIKDYKLYVNVPGVNNIGAKVDKWELIKVITVMVNFTDVKRLTDDIRYKDCEYTGLTAYKEMDIAKQYKLVCKEDTTEQYIVRSVNNIGRYSQCILQRVIA